MGAHGAFTTAGSRSTVLSCHCSTPRRTSLPAPVTLPLGPSSRKHQTQRQSGTWLASADSTGHTPRRPSVQLRAASPAAPWSADDLRSFEQDVDGDAEQILGETWRSHFADDPTSLYDYVDQAHELWHQQLEQVAKMDQLEQVETGAVQRLTQFPAAMASDLVGMGTWRLKAQLDQLIQLLVVRVEGSWRETLDEDLTLYPKDKWKDRGWDFADSLDPTNEWDQYAYVDVPDPEQGEEGYPRLLMENRVYCSRVFRKLHIEVACRQDGLNVVHIVLFPRYEYDLPILAMDLVCRQGVVTLAVVDACPVRPRLQLPQHYLQTMAELQSTFLPELPRRRKVPEWGTKIFSPLAVCITPRDPEQLTGFIKYAVALHRAHLQLSQLVQPVEAVDRGSLRRLEDLLAGHKNFVDRQLENKKTRDVIVASFGEEWTDEYLSKLIFDFDPTDNPPWVNGQLVKLYDYFDYHPEVGSAGDEVEAVRDELDTERADEIFVQIMSGEASAVSRPQVEWALQVRYKADAEFRASVLQVVPDADVLWAQGKLGKLLAREMPGLAESRDAWTKDEDEVVAQAEAARLDGGQQQGPPAAATAAGSSADGASGGDSQQTGEGQQQQQ